MHTQLAVSSQIIYSNTQAGQIHTHSYSRKMHTFYMELRAETRIPSNEYEIMHNLTKCI